jgi:hypothetical protein
MGRPFIKLQIFMLAGIHDLVDKWITLENDHSRKRVTGWLLTVFC